jgi:hypothetical protein
MEAGRRGGEGHRVILRAFKKVLKENCEGSLGLPPT